MITQSELYTAGLMARYSQSSYKLDQPIYRRFGKGACEGSVVRHGKACVLAFTGTDSIGDWATNLKVHAVRGPSDYVVHAGMWSALKPMHSLIYNLIVECIYHTDERHHSPATEFYITGHSLGAGLASLFAVDLAYKKLLPTITGVYMFGSPRSFSVTSSISYNSLLGHKTFRYVNESDIVARIPHIGVQWKKLWFVPYPSKVSMYRHVGVERWFNGDDWVSEPSIGDKWKKRWDNRGQTPSSISDHNIDEYVEKLPLDDVFV